MKKVLKTLSVLAMAFCLLVCATGCVSGTWEKAQQKLADKGYEVSAETGDVAIAFALSALGLEADAEDVDCMISAEKDGMRIVIIYCEEGETAKSLKTQMETKKADLMKQLNLNEDTVKMGKSGDVVYIGHKEAVKAA